MPPAQTGAGEAELLERYEAGYKEGYETAYKEGYEAGYKEGSDTGFDDGYAAGTQDAKTPEQSVADSGGAQNDPEALLAKYKASTYVCPSDITVKEDGWYYSKDEVGLYIHTFGKLPENFLSKKQAKSLGWSSGSLEKYAPGKVIGGSQFGNNEGLLPKAKGRTYTECDIDTKGEKSRGPKRIVFSNDGLVFYTEDHYETYELLYGKELL
ncbi:MAG: ribonuclease [Firmicutes bacterium]|nr:ribonuclease [Bacillota bacterium]